MICFQLYDLSSSMYQMHQHDLLSEDHFSSHHHTFRSVQTIARSRVRVGAKVHCHFFWFIAIHLLLRTIYVLTHEPTYMDRRAIYAAGTLVVLSKNVIIAVPTIKILSEP
jgi:hypothetical protein